MPTYQGACHCGAVTFRLAPDITGLTTCDCSLCRQKNALTTKLHERALTVLAGEDLLAVYERNTHRARHLFCSRCGVSTFQRKRAAPDHFGINVFCLEDVDPSAARRLTRDASNTTAQTKTPPPFPEAAFRVRTSKEENFLSLAGLAATYSPRA